MATIYIEGQGDITEKQFLSCLELNGVKLIETKGDNLKFDGEVRSSINHYSFGVETLDKLDI